MWHLSPIAMTTSKSSMRRSDTDEGGVGRGGSAGQDAAAGMVSSATARRTVAGVTDGMEGAEIVTHRGEPC